MFLVVWKKKLKLFSLPKHKTKKKVTIKSWPFEWFENGIDEQSWFKIMTIQKKKQYLAERGFDPRTSGLWAQHASTAPLCY